MKQCQSGAEFIRKEVPLHVLPTMALLNLDSPLASFTELQGVLYEEERTACNQAIVQNLRDGKVHPLAFIHHTSTYQASLCKLMEYCLSPAISALQDRLIENEIRFAMLSEEAKILEGEAIKGVDSRSPWSLSSHGARSGASQVSRDLYNPESTNSKSVSGSSSCSRRGS